jgi:hypothetical protein
MLPQYQTDMKWNLKAGTSKLYQTLAQFDTSGVPNGQLKYKIPDGRKWLQWRLWTWGWPTLVLFSFPLLFSCVHNTNWPTLQNSFYWVHHTNALFQKENDTSCSKQCFFWGGGRQIFTFFQPENMISIQISETVSSRVAKIQKDSLTSPPWSQNYASIFVIWSWPHGRRSTTKKIIIQSLSAKEGSNFFKVGFQINKILTIHARIARIESSVSSC